MLTRDCDRTLCYIAYFGGYSDEVHARDCINNPGFLLIGPQWGSLLDHENPAIDNEDVIESSTALYLIGSDVTHVDDFSYSCNTFTRLTERMPLTFHQPKSPEGVSYFPKDEAPKRVIISAPALPREIPVWKKIELPKDDAFDFNLHTYLVESDAWLRHVDLVSAMTMSYETIRRYWGLPEPTVDDHIILGYN